MVIVYDYYPENCRCGCLYRAEYRPVSKWDEERAIRLMREKPETYRLVEIRETETKGAESHDHC